MKLITQFLGKAASLRHFLGLAVVALVWAFAGCTEPITTYKTSSETLASGDKVLVMPFLDARTFTDPNDPYRETLPAHARDIFAEAMRDHDSGKHTQVLTPDLPAPEGSMTIAEVAEIGRRYGADYVVSGQIFSFTETRAASIPPRAGMFVRVVSTRDGSLAFVGDHYMSASVPGASGGRELQARLVANRLLDTMAEQAKAVARARAAAAAGLSAYASYIPGLAAKTMSAGQQKDGQTPDTPPPLPVPDFFEADAAEPAALDAKAPDVPPILDYGNGDDFYNFAQDDMTAKLDEKKPAANDQDNTASDQANAAAAAQETQSADSGDPAAPDQAVLLPPPPEVAEMAETLQEEAAEEPESAAAPASVYEAPDMPPLPEIAKSENTESEPAVKEPVAALDAHDVIAAARRQAGLEAEASQAVLETQTAKEENASEETVAQASAETQTETAAEEPAVEPAVAAAPAAPELKSGDELAADLFGEEGYSIVSGVRDTVIETAETEMPDSAASAAEVANAPAVQENAESNVIIPSVYQNQETPGEQTANSPYRTQRDYFEAIGEPMPSGEIVINEQQAAASAQTPAVSGVYTLDETAAPVAAAPGATIVQPTPIMTTGGAVVTAAPGDPQDKQFRVLLLPYHDRDNPDNLVLHTGGGEVVTALFGSRLATEPGVQVLWAGGPEYSHQRLLSIGEALNYARAAGVDYVVRGQVVEFRRAQSVPSFYSAVISTALLAAQIFFAEISGVDVATEVYRVSDGMCVMSRRDRSQQKYVVQAEKTVRRLADGMTADVVSAMRNPNALAMDPLIDSLSTTPMLSSIQ